MGVSQNGGTAKRGGSTFGLPFKHPKRGPPFGRAPHVSFFYRGTSLAELVVVTVQWELPEPSDVCTRGLAHLDHSV